MHRISSVVNPSTWFRYQVPHRISYQQQFIPSTIPFQQQIALPLRPRHIIKKQSRAVVIIDPLTKQPIELVKSSSSNSKNNRINSFSSSNCVEYSRKEQLEGKSLNNNQSEGKLSETNQNCDLSFDNDIKNSDVVVEKEELENTEAHEPDLLISNHVPIIELEIVNDEENKSVDESIINLPDPVPEVKQDKDLPIKHTIINLDPTHLLFVESKPSKAVTSKVSINTKISNEVKFSQLSKKNAKNKRRRHAISNKQ